ncbi:hypothetical protein [Streptomyces sp. RK62]|uniref:hypothetical protein n=1 Tax=Streptomyces sp. RK62 TaxID=2824893 RepID=UPI001B372464|nr:hypothetical protein [Streptomyces sp. RK62]MBQ0996297.1 hypothetical protein [Streptomyces sp. RK62]
MRNTSAARVTGTLVFRALASMLLGGALGLGIYAVSNADATYLFAITGGLTGVVVALGLDVYRRAGRLTEVRVTVPQLSELTFVVNNDARQVSWQLFIESVTRVSVQPLDDEEGLLREALSSLYSLFATTRETLKVSRPSVHANNGLTVEHLAVNFLNAELRPFLTKWHPRLRAFEEESPQRPEHEWGEAAQCRAELRQVQANARQYVLAYARLAGVKDAQAIIDGSRIHV